MYGEIVVPKTATSRPMEFHVQVIRSPSIPAPTRIVGRPGVCRGCARPVNPRGVAVGARLRGRCPHPRSERPSGNEATDHPAEGWALSRSRRGRQLRMGQAGVSRAEGSLPRSRTGPQQTPLRVFGCIEHHHCRGARRGRILPDRAAVETRNVVSGNGEFEGGSA
jgi:hypothetical protein